MNDGPARRPEATLRGRFITFEGVDGAGKSTQLDRVHQRLLEDGLPVLRTREPGGTALGERLRDLLLGTRMDAVTETLMMYAARRQHVVECIQPALAQGRWVLCDRFIDASHAYQGGGRGVDAALLATLDAAVAAERQPDLTILVDLEPAQAQQRREAARAADRFEAESLAFFLRVREAYLARAAREPARFLVLDGALAPEVLEAGILARLAAWR